MNWNAIGAIAELLGGLGVIITLIFLALQIRHNASAVQSETLAALTHTMTGNMLTFAQNGELSHILRRGLTNLSGLSEDDQFRFQISMSTTLRHYETALFAHNKGMLEGESWAGIEAMLLQLFETRGVRTYWASQSELFSRQFRHYIQEKTGLES